MRKHLVWVAGLAAVFAAVNIAVAASGTTQKISGKVTPSKLPENKRVGVSLKFSETTGTTDPSGVQPATASAKIFFDKDFVITTKGLPQCKIGQIEGKSTTEAKAACGEAQVGFGSAVARISDGGTGHIDIPAAVTAFNGNPRSQTPTAGCEPVKTRPCIYLHVELGAASTDVVLEVTKATGAYGTELATIPGRVPVPIRSLTLALHRSFTVHGERENYIAARCSHKKLLYKGRFTYTGSPPLTAKSSQKCTTTR